MSPPRLSLILIYARRNMTEATAVANFLLRQLNQVDPRPLKGSELSVLARTVYPEFRPESFNCRTLREFIRKFVPEAVEFGRAGMDTTYLLRSTKERLGAETSASPGSNLATDQLENDRRIWKTFVTPDSRLRIFLLPEGHMRVLYPYTSPVSTWREIPKISAEALLQIGRDFTTGLEDEATKAILSPLLSEPKWWIPYFERLQSLGLKSKWIEFRRRRIRQEFEQRIGAMAQPVTTEAGSTSALRQVPSTETSVTTQSESAIRRIAADVVQRMTESELRALSLPLGYVMDSLTTR